MKNLRKTVIIVCSVICGLLQTVFVSVIAFVVFLFAKSVTDANEMTEWLNALEPETDLSQIAYVSYSTLTVGENELDFYQLIDKASDGKDRFREVFLVQNDSVWFCYCEGTKIWNIATVSVTGENLRVVYSGKFCEQEGSDTYYYPKGWDVDLGFYHGYAHEVDNQYLEANGFYYDGKIVLTDHVKLVEMDIATETVTESSAEEYPYPTPPLVFETEPNNFHTIWFRKGEEAQIFNTESGIQTSAAFRKLMELESEKTWDDTSFLHDLFFGVQSLSDGRVYIMCRVLDYSGGSHAVVFQYDFEKNAVQYVLHHYTNDVPEDDFYLVPQNA